MSAKLYTPLLELKTPAEAEAWIAARVAAVREGDPAKLEGISDADLAELERSSAVAWFARFNHLQHDRIKALFNPEVRSEKGEVRAAEPSPVSPPTSPLTAPTS